MERQHSVSHPIRRSIVGGLAALVVGGALLGAPVAPAAASGVLPGAARIATAQNQFVVGFTLTGGKIVDVHALIGEPFEQVVRRNGGARWEFGYDGSFRFVPADDSPVMVGYWDVRQKQQTVEIEAAAIFEGEAGLRYQVGMRGQIDLKDGLARIEQGRQVIQGGNGAMSYTEFTIALY
ncbi:MAG: hypothetical protein IT340_02765 [Chloroflexi bacterium]|nr:hypothetical protein [Chloroflexota bacterium]